MTLGEAFSIRLQQYLAERKMTLYKFVKDCCISKSTITNLMLGNSKSPTLKTIYQVARGLEISPLEFLDCDLFDNEELIFD